MCIGRKLAKFTMLLICIKKKFGIKLLHAHLQYVCIIPAKYQINILKALGGVDFTKYALLPISQYVHLDENWLSSKCSKFVKKIGH